MRIGVGLDARLDLSLGQLGEAAREAERLGFQSVWSPAGGVPDAFHICSAWAQATGLRTGISVVPAARMWHPRSLAAQAATVGLISGGRFALGIGTGGSGPGFWSSVGMPDRPIAVMRDFLAIVRPLLAGETVDYRGEVLEMRGASLGARDLPPVPVHLAALGRQMLRLAGQASDGALLNWATPARVAESMSLVAEGAREAGRQPADVPLTMYVRVCIDPDVGAARTALAKQVLSYAMSVPGAPLTSGYRGLFGQMGFEEVLRELEERRDKGSRLDELARAVPEELITSVGYYGPPGPGAVAAGTYAKLSEGLDETIVRVVTARPGLEAVVTAMEALAPAKIRAAAAESALSEPTRTRQAGP